MPGPNARYRAEVEWVRKRESQQRHTELWSSQCKYYDNFTRANQRFENWTSPDLYAENLEKYNKREEDRKREREKEEERNRRDLELFKQKQEQEIAQKQPKRSQRRHYTVHDDIPTEILQDVNYSLKAKEEARQRREAELKLYQHWQMNNPLVRDCNVKQRAANCKLAWLDAQIQKQMTKEKEEEEMKKLLEERDRKIKEEEQKEREYQAQLNTKQKEVDEIIGKQIEELKQKDAMSELYRREEAIELRRKDELDQLTKERDEDQRSRVRQEHDLFNLNQVRLKLRRRGKMIAEEIASEKRVFERILHSQRLEELTSAQNALNLREAIETAIDCLKQQEIIENKRQEYLSFIFDSEAKVMWEKQEYIWRMEQRARDELFDDVMLTLRKQIDEKIAVSIEKQKQLVVEKEAMLELIEQADSELKREKDDVQSKVLERKKELDAMINDKKIREKVLADIEKREREKEIENAKKEEQKLRQEIENIQLKSNANPHRIPRRRILW